MLNKTIEIVKTDFDGAYQSVVIIDFAVYEREICFVHIKSVPKTGDHHDLIIEQRDR